ncbi:hypothetical protein C8R46DRAFT_892209 [Mycena filopes]|nr:hypothetical protein C8R46DRAFT_892209 [Mycena filopes]
MSAWNKSLGLALNAPDNLPSHLLMPTIDPINPSPHSIPMEPVRFCTDHAEFLRVAVNDPASQFTQLQDIVAQFQFPVLSRRLPLTALRKAVSQCLVSKLHPKLSLQPIQQKDAEKLDAMIAQKVHAYLGFPFPFNSTLLSLPVALHGFEFPSISRINDSAAVAGIQRDLNHHVPVFRNMARITLADWTCSVNHCCSPFDGSMDRTFIRQKRNIPWSWILAQLVHGSP